MILPSNHAGMTDHENLPLSLYTPEIVNFVHDFYKSEPDCKEVILRRGAENAEKR